MACLELLQHPEVLHTTGIHGLSACNTSNVVQRRQSDMHMHLLRVGRPSSLDEVSRVRLEISDSMLYIYAVVSVVHNMIIYIRVGIDTRPRERLQTLNCK